MRGQNRAVAQAVIIGGGMIASVHRKALLTLGVDIVGVLDSTPEGGRDLASRWRVPQVFESLDAVAESDVDMVHICAPNSVHAPYAERLLESGKNVICEKPLATSFADAQRLANLAGEKGLVAVVPFIYRYYSVVREIRARVLDGTLGDLNLLHGSYLQDWLLNPTSSNWRVFSATGGKSRAFADIGSHWCDLVEWVSGERIASLTAQTSIAIPERPKASSATFSAANHDRSSVGTLMPVDTEDTASMLFVTDHGTPGVLSVSQVAAGRKNQLHFEIDGSTGSAVFNQESPDRALLADANGEVSIHQRGSLTRGRTEDLGPGHPQGWDNAFTAFIQDAYLALSEEASSALPTFTDGARSMRLVETLIESAKTHEWKEV